MKKKLVAFLLVLSAIAPSAQAAEIVLEPSAVEKLVRQALFKDRGRFVVLRGVCEAWLDSPRVSLPTGRVQVVARLASGGACMGVELASQATISGVPVADGGLVRLRDVRVDVSDPTVRGLMDQLGISFLLPRVIDLDVEGAVRAMLAQGAGDLQATVDSFSFQDVSVASNRLAMRFDFKLTGR